jgi:hypothetical protein
VQLPERAALGAVALAQHFGQRVDADAVADGAHPAVRLGGLRRLDGLLEAPYGP